ncbi:Arylacetamide deacetylase [Bagarius yarrelli]|uniref:Arylacetamide deacetylase n=1 Tax=Bagarius yarrelli TaxID=175774 RepID=A0A556U726_BAGYA|nr:Arylacetamide deacetylase [Bagarius yarrelli]
MRSTGTFVFLCMCALTAYYIYTPVPENIEQRWKLMITDCFFRSLGHLADLSELLGLADYMDVMMLVTFLERVVPVSDERVKVTEASFDGVEVLVYESRLDRRKSEKRRSVIYLHGGGWCLGSAKMGPYDLLARQMVTELDAVVVSIEYRLAPLHHFPVPFDDVYHAVKYFLQPDVLDRYEVDPERVAVSGDSAGGNLAAVVTQQLHLEPDQLVKIKVQALIYPALQALDLNTPSYQQNRHMPILPRTLMVRFWSEYFTSDKSILTSMMTNKHNSAESAAMLKFVNWSIFLPEPYRRTYNYSALSISTDKTLLSLADPRASPLIAPDAVLHHLPKTYILTCEYDVLRDDGVMYVTRLRLAGVNVTHEHYEEGFHGTIMFTMWPTEFQIAHRMTDNYLLWLRENL